MSVLWLILALLPILGGAERFSCRGRILGAYYADAKSGCKAFHVCVRVAGGGIRDFRFFCPPGTLFHQEAQTCTDWGDDDPLACPADLYDGQFDLYKIGSGFDTKKLSSSNAREEEQEFGLQRAETGDRRLQQNSGSSNGASDLRAAHSSDFFSGQRERGRDDSAPPAPSAAPQPAPQRNSFRRPTTRVPSPFPTTQYTAAPSSLSPSQQPQFDERKRKLVRKRPIYYSTSPAPSTFAQSSPNPRQYFPEQNQKQQSFRPEQNQQQNYQKQEQIQQQQNYPKPEQKQTQNYPRPEQKQQNFRQQEQAQQNYPRPEQQNYPRPEQQNYQKVEQKQQQNYQRPNGEQKFNAPAPANVPPEYKDEYVEVSRVTPKSRNFQTATSSPSFPQSTPSQRFNKKEGLTDVFNYESPSTASFNPSERPFKVRNSFNVAPDVPRTKDVPRKNVAVSPNGVRASPSTVDYNTAAPSTVNYRNFNSVSYEPEKNNFAQFTGKQKYFNSPSTTPGTTAFTTSSRPDTSARLNTVAYNTNIGFNAQPINYSESDEDDGQYRPPEGEDDGQYRPELYEKELLSGAHSLNIAASGNRLPEDQKPRTKPTSQSAPRPFRPAPTPSTPAPPPPSTTRAPEPTYTTTFRPQTSSTQRTFDYFQTYTTTARPEVERIPQAPSSSRAPARETPASRAPPPPTVAPTTRAPVHKAPPPPHFAQPANNKEDNSYDYAYYDTDSGFSEYDQIEEFGKTKARSS